MYRDGCAELVDRCETVIHLAAAVGVRLIIESPVRTIETNIKGTEIVLELAEKKKKKVVLASTSEVYGKSDRAPFSETSDLVLGPTTKGRWSYACSKAIDEFLALAYCHEKKVPVKTAAKMLSNVLYGSKYPFPYQVHHLIAGYDSQGPKLYDIGGYGSILDEKFSSTGSGSGFA